MDGRADLDVCRAKCSKWQLNAVLGRDGKVDLYQFYRFAKTKMIIESKKECSI